MRRNGRTISGIRREERDERAERERERERMKTEKKPNESTGAIACTRALCDSELCSHTDRLYAIAIDIYT